MPDSEAAPPTPVPSAGRGSVVTGAAQGIGASTLHAYVAAGADVAALDVNAGDGRRSGGRGGCGGSRYGMVPA